MKSIISSLILLSAACTMSACSSQDGPVTDPRQPDNTVPAKTTGMALGADVSWLTEMEAKGDKFFTPGTDRRQMECMRLLRDYCGVNSIRLRVWVNPEQGWNSIDDVVLKARRAEQLGMRTMIDFHFSDTWADPGNQYCRADGGPLPSKSAARVVCTTRPPAPTTPLPWPRPWASEARPTP